MPRRPKDKAAAKEARRARREAKREMRATSGKPGSLPFPGSSHIKQNTHGTSNEISFSVLHARKNASSGVSGKKVNGVPITPRTMAEVAAEKARDDAHAALGITSSAEEASRRNSPRHQQRTRGIVAIACAAAAAVLVVAFIAVSSLYGEAVQNELTPAVDLIEEADNTLFSFDGIVVSAMGSSLPEMVEQDTAVRYEVCLPTLTTAEEQMKQARAIIEAARPELMSNEDKEAAEQMLITLDAREQLIAAGEQAMNETVTVIDLYECVDDGWNGLLNADALARDAAALSAYTTSATQQAALDKTDEAIDAFATVRAQFEQARNDIAEQRGYQAQAHPTDRPATGEADGAQGEGAAEGQPPAGDPEALALLDSLDGILAHYLDYIELRIQAQYEAKRSTQAIIDHDSAAAQEANNAYNQLDSRAVSFIRGTVELPTEYVTKLFELEREGLFAPYETIRAQTSEIDAYLGDYLATLGR